MTMLSLGKLHRDSVSSKKEIILLKLVGNRVNLELAAKKISPSTGKNTKLDLESCCICKCGLAGISNHMDIHKVPRWNLLQQWIHSEGKKITSGISA